jgi:hypothetical protein
MERINTFNSVLHIVTGLAIIIGWPLAVLFTNIRFASRISREQALGNAKTNFPVFMTRALVIISVEAFIFVPSAINHCGGL